MLLSERRLTIEETEALKGLRYDFSEASGAVSCSNTLLWRASRRLPAGLAIRETVREMLQCRYHHLPNSQLRERIAGWLSSGQYDLVVTRHLAPALVSGVLDQQDVPVLVDSDDVLSESYLLRRAATAGRYRRFLLSLLGAQRRSIEHRGFRRAAHVWFASEDDRERFGNNRSSVLPNIPFDLDRRTIQPQPPRTSSREMLFVGTLSWHPNRDALTWFVSNVLEQVRNAVPDARLRVVGAGCATAEPWQEAAGVEFVGYAPDLAREYGRCAFTVAPVRYGAGTKVKVLESLAHGRTCVATEHAVYGIARDFTSGSAFVVAATEEAFAGACIRLLSAPDECQRMAACGRAEIEARYTREQFNRRVRLTVERVLSRQPATNGSSL